MHIRYIASIWALRYMVLNPLPNTSVITFCDATIEDCQSGLSAAGGSSDEITPYSCATLAKVHPPPSPTLEDPPNPSLPHLAPPNLIVDLPRECPERPPPLLPPPRGRGLDRGDSWEMSYANLLLEEGLGWGNSGIVVKAILAKDKDNKVIGKRLARLAMGQGGTGHQWIVAVKRTKGGSIMVECFCGYIYTVRIQLRTRY